MKRIRKAFLVCVDLDPTPGAFHTEKSAEEFLGTILQDRIPHYNPVVSLAPENLQPLSNIEVRNNES